MRNYDPYKKTILFTLSLINILLMTFLFSWFWYHFFAGTMYSYQFYRRGNYVVIGLYALFLIFFGRMYGATKLGQLRRIEIILSQFLSIFISNLVTYIIISLLAFRFINVLPVLAMTLGDYIITTLWYFGASMKPTPTTPPSPARPNGTTSNYVPWPTAISAASWATSARVSLPRRLPRLSPCRTARLSSSAACATTMASWVRSSTLSKWAVHPSRCAAWSRPPASNGRWPTCCLN